MELLNGARCPGVNGRGGGRAPESPENRVLRVAAELVLERCAPAHWLRSVTLRVRGPGGARLSLHLRAHGRGGDSAPGPGLRTVHRKLLSVATAKPTPGKVLATRAGYSGYHSHVRQALTDLARCGNLLQTPDGYKVPAEEAPSPAKENGNGTGRQRPAFERPCP